MANPIPAVAKSPVCKIGRRCHVSGRGIRKFGSKFPNELVKNLAISSVGLVVPNNSLKPFASGTLVGRAVVLCAAHSLSNLNPNDIEILLCFECYTRTDFKPRSCS